MRRLYNAICGALEAYTEAMAAPEQHNPQGDNFTQAEHAHSYTAPPELHTGYREQSIDDDNGARTPLGFTRRLDQ